MYAKNYPSPVTFSNRFGTVEVVPVSAVMKVSEILKDNPLAVANEFTLSDAEKIALITENDGIQICPHFAPITGNAFLMLHYSSGTAAICSVKVNYSSQQNPTEALIRGF